MKRHLAAIVLATALAGCSETVHHAMDERASTEVVVTLDHYGIPAERVEAGEGLYDVRVPRSQRRDALNVLASLGLPRRADGPDPALSQSAGLVPSPDQERLRRLATTTAALESTLLAMDGVLDARVHAVAPVAERLGASVEAPRASVVLVERANAQAPDDEAVRAIVVGAIEGLAPDAVSIVRSSVELPPPPPTELVQVGPWSVAAASEASLRSGVFGLASAVLVLAAFVVAFAVRSARRGDAENAS
jgi:type III secretion protein J